MYFFLLSCGNICFRDSANSTEIKMFVLNCFEAETKTKIIFHILFFFRCFKPKLVLVRAEYKHIFLKKWNQNWIASSIVSSIAFLIYHFHRSTYQAMKTSKIMRKKRATKNWDNKNVQYEKQNIYYREYSSLCKCKKKNNNNNFLRII